MKIRSSHINLFPYCFFLLTGIIGFACELLGYRELSKLVSVIMKSTYFFLIFLVIYNFKALKEKVLIVRVVLAVGSAFLFYVFAAITSLLLVQLMIKLGVSL